ncbi:RluA family pseudouridine synthase [Cytobacillus purgationiresistens]|uniref:Pseudouridine synthase n=1 Tax=Cytobacillus purgationiresistens TaxID=863449 RepID=A0ABU0AF45_9BACI|nr:RluA family pseudouridine synthase [Cytobacillus purgationiresistens]MDQ0268715.1 23S rRNA pseudouridine1911/1915/1917 synthase [Cytobacillus purgationiresistens]
MELFKLVWVISENMKGMTIKQFLKENDISKTALTDIKFSGGFIKVNQVKENVRYALKHGDVLEIGFPEEKPSNAIMGEDIPLHIIYEDDYVLVVNKPAAMNTIPSREHPTGSLANAMIHYYEKINLSATVHIVTRLDRYTSGLVLIAKHRHIHHLLSKLQQQNGVHRIYEAFAEGTISRNEGIVEQPIARKPTSIIEREVNEAGKYACTHYQVIERTNAFSVVRLKLETGRTHQIRVHLAHMGHPLMGDDLYGGQVNRIKRQALHCIKLSFYHPVLHQTIELEQPLPEDMNLLLQR